MPYYLNVIYCDLLTNYFRSLPRVEGDEQHTQCQRDLETGRTEPSATGDSHGEGQYRAGSRTVRTEPSATGDSHGEGQQWRVSLYPKLALFSTLIFC